MGRQVGGIVDGSRRTGKGSYFNKTRLQTKKEGRAHAQGGRRRKGPRLRVEKEVNRVGRMYHTEPRLSFSFASFYPNPGDACKKENEKNECHYRATGLVAAEVGDLHHRPRWVKGAGPVLTLASVHPRETPASKLACNPNSQIISKG